MLCVNTYAREYVRGCRSRIAAQVASYRALVTAARDQASSKTRGQLDEAIEEFEPHFFGSRLLALDSYFVHRTRAAEGKDGNPLNEARMLCNAIMNNKNILAADKTIKDDPAKSVLKIRVGDEIAIDAPAFERISSAFFAEIDKKYR